ncbi:ABC transporter substrate-binding protein [Phyllobacterium phragmitis]|uniref:ABC transporter substrate-binding protein n=1 Tax=Phyllobacterium phragmitis TaxID=2670329 RepID=A0A2S9IPC8_9HYPH|nr:acyclic terpene utilization AtuA family protein [Phyllobacterium phragmitis]PRD42388.1 ABC transporter substrate-binding protein [Phyllobacterium phragmitis]
MRTIRVGAGAGFSGDRIEPAVELAEKGELDFLVFECLAERTIALAQLARMADPNAGYDPMLERRMQAVLPACAARGTRIISNMGAANPLAAAEKVREIADQLGLGNLKIAAVTGDDVIDAVIDGSFVLDETGAPACALGDRLISANAYIGASPIVSALEAGADIVLTGRASDPAMFLAPLVHSFGWAMDDWHRLGCGTVIGHLLECAAQVTGGYFADPEYKDVPNLARLGFPLAEVAKDGDAVITKVAGTGGQVTRATCTEQLLYEIHDPSCYAQPDVIADFSRVTLAEDGPDRIRVSGATGTPRTGMLKVSVGYDDGWLGEGQISYAGPGAEARGRLAIELLRERLAANGPAVRETRGELIGVDAILGNDGAYPCTPREVRVRFAARCVTRADAARIGEEVESLYLNGPSGGGGATRSVRQILGVASTLIPEELVETRVQMVES